MCDNMIDSYNKHKHIWELFPKCSIIALLKWMIFILNRPCPHPVFIGLQVARVRTLVKCNYTTCNMLELIYLQSLFYSKALDPHIDK